MQQMSTKMQQNQKLMKWRRAKVMELLSKGESNQSEIAKILQVDKSIICRDLLTNATVVDDAIRF
jgi:DNA-binding MarR family transcriptional regulator